MLGITLNVFNVQSGLSFGWLRTGRACLRHLVGVAGISGGASVHVAACACLEAPLLCDLVVCILAVIYIHDQVSVLLCGLRLVSRNLLLLYLWLLKLLHLATHDGL